MKRVLSLAICAALSIGVVQAKQERSETAKNEFKYTHPCPANGNNHGPCPGFVIDHIKPLACGGADAPSNMQWQTVAQGKAKDKWERKDCGLMQVKGRRSSSSGSHRSRRSSSGGGYASGGSRSASGASGSNNGYYTGPRGGCYTLSNSGKKRYVDHSFCS